METSIVGVGVSVSDRFRTVAEEKAVRIENLAPRAQRLDIKVTHRAYHNGGREDETVELTVTGKGPVVRAEATDSDKFVALDLAVDKLAEQLRRAKDKRIDARNHPRGAKLDKGSGSLAGIDVQPASVDVLRAVATGGIPIVGDDVEAASLLIVLQGKNAEADVINAAFHSAVMGFGVVGVVALRAGGVECFVSGFVVGFLEENVGADACIAQLAVVLDRRSRDIHVHAANRSVLVMYGVDGLD